MPGGAAAVSSGSGLRQTVVYLGERLGLEVRIEVRVGRRVWGAVRYIDVVLTHPTTRLALGVECKFQATSGSAEEKIAAVLNDIAAWPIRGIVVIAGPGFSANMRGYLLSTGKVLDLADLGDWLALFFGLEPNAT